MPDITLDFPIAAPPAAVFDAVSTPAGLDQWWTTRSAGTPSSGAVYDLWFDPDFHWRAEVVRYAPPHEIAYRMIQSDDDWAPTTLTIQLEPRDGGTWVRFRHAGWPEENEHFRVSCNCWALYLRVLRRWIEHGEEVPYAERLDV